MKEIIYDLNRETDSAREVRENLSWRENGFGGESELSCALYAARVKPMDGRAFFHNSPPPFNRLLYCSGAGITVQCDKRQWSVPDGKGILLPVGVPFHAHYAPQGTLLFLHFNCRNRIGEDIFKGESAPILLSDFSCRLAECLCRDGAGAGCCGILLRMAMDLMPPAARARWERSQNLGTVLPRFFTLLAQVPPAQARVKELAAELQISTSTLEREFQSYLHCSVKDFLAERLKEQMLLAIQNPVPSFRILAQDLGFADAAYFHRVFKRFFGTSPAAFLAHSGSKPTEGSLRRLELAPMR